MAYIERDRETARTERRSRRLRLLGWSGAGIVGAALVVGLLMPDDDAPETGRPTASLPEAPAAAGPVSDAQGGPDQDPLVTARRWLQASRTVQFTDPAPTAWVGRVEPLLTGAEIAAAGGQAASGGSNAGWDQFLAARCKTTVNDVDAVIPPEAPREPDSVYVQVTGVVDTTCQSKDYPVPTESASATIALTLGSDGLWRVSERLY